MTSSIFWPLDEVPQQSLIYVAPPTVPALARLREDVLHLEPDAQRAHVTTPAAPVTPAPVGHKLVITSAHWRLACPAHSATGCPPLVGCRRAAWPLCTQHMLMIRSDQKRSHQRSDQIGEIHENPMEENSEVHPPIITINFPMVQPPIRVRPIVGHTNSCHGLVPPKKKNKMECPPVQYKCVSFYILQENMGIIRGEIKVSLQSLLHLIVSISMMASRMRRAMGVSPVPAAIR